MFDMRNWLIEIVIAIFFISGFVAFYNTLTVWLTRKFENYKHGRRYTRTGLTVFAFVMAAFCLLAENWNPVNSDAYMNWALYVLFVPLLDRNVSHAENVVRYLGIVLFWVLNNNLNAPIFWLSLIPLEVMMIITYWWADIIDHSRILTLGMAMWMAIAFWLTQTQLMLINIVIGVIMFALMNLFTVLYWSAERRESRERAQLVEQVNRDTLTGAGSFFAFKDDSMRLMPRSRVRSEPLTLAMFDIDHFKQVNDRYGHAAGNEVLQDVTKIITELITEKWGDQCGLYRTGGEEFNIIFLNATASQITPIGVIILDRIRNHQFAFEQDCINVTLSMGITTLKAEDMSFEDVYERADESLYASKQHGRDCITVERHTLTPES